MLVEFHKKFFKDLDGINENHILNDIEQFINLLKNFNGRYRTGDYQLGFFFQNSKILIRRVGLRDNFYKIFPFLFA
jgi:mRNA-degrading endonuclease RelE of RelBE toxin-antitoxin system